MSNLVDSHFLLRARADVFVRRCIGVPDTTTVAAHDFDVDTRTGFLPPQPPISRLPSDWNDWEVILDDAVSSRLQLGDKSTLHESEKWVSERWRNRVRNVRISIHIDERSTDIFVPSFLPLQLMALQVLKCNYDAHTMS